MMSNAQENKQNAAIENKQNASSSPPGQSSDDPPRLNPAQEKVIRLLGVPRHSRPEFDPDLGQQLRSELESGLAPLTASIDSGSFKSRSLRLTKHTLGKVLGCEHNFIAEQAIPFAWSPPLARGSISHKAIELALHWKSEPHPLDLVDMAMERLAESERYLGDYLKSCSDMERAELRAEANQRVVKFLECFPPLKTAWTPVTESSMRAALLGERVLLNGKPDLILGRPDGNVAGKVIIDFKSGRFSTVHREDLHFYALIETLRLGVPPRMLATYYLDSGDAHPETVTDELLQTTVARVVEGARIYVEITAGQREPSTAPGPTCRWCPVRADCAAGIDYLSDGDIT